ncbi:MAG: hypothetical protein R3B82_16945 [Sandaracinaceae bacterium]
MAVLLATATGQVRDRLDASARVRRGPPPPPTDRFHLEHAQKEAAVDALFALARGLFERRNVEGMRQRWSRCWSSSPITCGPVGCSASSKRADGTDDNGNLLLIGLRAG